MLHHLMKGHMLQCPFKHGYKKWTKETHSKGGNGYCRFGWPRVTLFLQVIKYLIFPSKRTWYLLWPCDTNVSYPTSQQRLLFFYLLLLFVCFTNNIQFPDHHNMLGWIVSANQKVLHLELRAEDGWKNPRFCPLGMSLLQCMHRREDMCEYVVAKHLIVVNIT